MHLVGIELVTSLHLHCRASFKNPANKRVTSSWRAPLGKPQESSKKRASFGVPVRTAGTSKPGWPNWNTTARPSTGPNPAGSDPSEVCFLGDGVKKAGTSKPGRPSRKATARPIAGPNPAGSDSSEDVKDDQDDDEDFRVTAAEPDDQHKARQEADCKKRKHVSFAEPLSTAAPAEAKKPPQSQDAIAKSPSSAAGAPFPLACRLFTHCILNPCVIPGIHLHPHVTCYQG